MASRFEIVDEEYIEELKDGSENEKKSSTGWWKNVSKSGRIKKKTMSLRAMLLTSNRIGSSRLGQIQHRENTRDIDP